MALEKASYRDHRALGRISKMDLNTHMDGRVSLLPGNLRPQIQGL